MSKAQGCLGAIAASIFLWAVIFFCVQAFAQPQREPYNVGGRPFVGIALICGTLEPGEQIGCERVRTRELFQTFDECVAQMPELLDRQGAAILRRFPRANIQMQWNCIVAEGFFEA